MPFDSKKMICGNCRYHVPSDKYPWEWECRNEESENYLEFTDYEETCEAGWDFRPPKERKKHDRPTST